MFACLRICLLTRHRSLSPSMMVSSPGVYQNAVKAHFLPHLLSIIILDFQSIYVPTCSQVGYWYILTGDRPWSKARLDQGATIQCVSVCVLQQYTVCVCVCVCVCLATIHSLSVCVCVCVCVCVLQQYTACVCIGRRRGEGALLLLD